MGNTEIDDIRAAVEKWRPGRKEQVEELAGAEIEYVVDLESFAGDAKGLSWLEMNGPNQLTLAYRILCADPAGKAAVRGGIKRVVFSNVAEAEERSIALGGGVLALHCAFAKSPAGRYSDREIRQFLQEHLGGKDSSAELEPEVVVHRTDEAGREFTVKQTEGVVEVTEKDGETSRLAAPTGHDVPEGFPGDFPIPTEYSRMSSLVMKGKMAVAMTVPEPEEQVLEFYARELAALGWKVSEDEMDGPARCITYEKEGREVGTVTYKVDDGTSLTLGVYS